MNDKTRIKRIEYELCNRKQIYLLNGYKFRLRPEFKKNQIYSNAVSLRFRISPDSLVELATDVVREFKLPDVFHWTYGQVQTWIEAIGYAEYKETFNRNHINGHTLILVDAEALIKMNIKNHLHIRFITKSIRKLYGIEITNYFRHILLPFHNLWTKYLIYFANRSPHSQIISAIDFWKKYQIIQPIQKFEDHWKILENWLKNPKSVKTTSSNHIIGCNGIHSNLYKNKNISKEKYNSSSNIRSCNNCKYRNLLQNTPNSELENDIKMLVINSLEYNKRLQMLEKSKIMKIVKESKKFIRNECICDDDPCRCLSILDFCNCIPSNQHQPKSFILSTKPLRDSFKNFGRHETRKVSMNINQEPQVREKLLMVLPSLADLGDDMN